MPTWSGASLAGPHIHDPSGNIRGGLTSGLNPGPRLADAAFAPFWPSFCSDRASLTWFSPGECLRSVVSAAFGCGTARCGLAAGWLVELPASDVPAPLIWEAGVKVGRRDARCVPGSPSLTEEPAPGRTGGWTGSDAGVKLGLDPGLSCSADG